MNAVGRWDGATSGENFADVIVLQFPLLMPRRGFPICVGDFPLNHMNIDIVGYCPISNEAKKFRSNTAFWSFD
eukprot:s2315_g18.t1